MGDVNFLAVLLGTIAFWLLGLLWYGPLFGKAWRAEAGQGEPGPHEHGNPMWLILALSFAFELLVVLLLGHLVARTSPAPHVVMMMAVGLGASVMAPAIGISYLFQRRSGRLFAIDAGYFVAGMAAAGAVFVLLAGAGRV